MIINKLKKLTAITAMAALALTAAAVPVTQADAAGTDTATAEFYVSYDGENYVSVPYGMGTGNIKDVAINDDTATITFGEATYAVPGGNQTGYISGLAGDALDGVKSDEDGVDRDIAMTTSAVVDLTRTEEIDGKENATHVSFDVISEGEYFTSLPGVIQTPVSPVTITDVILVVNE